MKTTSNWWETAVIYQIYPRSFCDANGDGIGDLQGIISRLDYLQELGIDALWISPFYRSPQADFGYDISDYRSLSPEYGTMDDCLDLIRAAHSRGMYVIFDMVLNHTSDQHPWFIESRSSRDNPRRDWYVWKQGPHDESPKRRPPNNWRSKVSGSGWHWDETAREWYWAAFLPFQPDLNWRNPEVKREMFDTIRYWLGLGVDGFRLDIIGSLFEDADFRDNPPSGNLLPSGADSGMFFQSTVMTENLPETLAFVSELRSVVDEFTDPPRYLVGETFGGPDMLRKYLHTADGKPGLHSVFLFEGIDAPFTASSVRRMIAGFEDHFASPDLPTLVYSNHDVMRRISVLGNDERKARLSLLLQLTLRGIPFLYNGEEFGMLQRFFPFRASLDPVAGYFAWMPVFLQRFVQNLMKGRISRDGCRTPLYWEQDEPNHGFSTPDARPWLPFSGKPAGGGAFEQTGDGQSLLEFTRKLIRLRRSHPVLARGSVHLDAEDRKCRGLISWERRLPGEESLRIVLNLSERQYTCPPGSVVFATYPHVAEGIIPPWGGVILG